jgi:hypothetical protein
MGEVGIGLFDRQGNRGVKLDLPLAVLRVAREGKLLLLLVVLVLNSSLTLP